MAAGTSPHPYPYPYAAAADLIRAHQKDTSITTHLASSLADLHRRISGARAAHASAPSVRALVAPVVYLGLTTLAGRRTLGEEHCDLVLVRGGGTRLPRWRVRGMYVFMAVILPFYAGRAAPKIATWLAGLVRRRLERLESTSLPPFTSSPEKTQQDDQQVDGQKEQQQQQHQQQPSTLETRILHSILNNLSSPPSTAPLHALGLAIFYFNGAYYELSKRLLSLRYIFTRVAPDTPDRAGYEVLGLLIAVQLTIQAVLHLRSSSSISTPPASSSTTHSSTSPTTPSSISHAPTTTTTIASSSSAEAIAIPSTPHFDLADDKIMPYIRGAQQRKCTLCLEELKDPAATQCGHVFCWECIGDWVREKPECPLCRREAMVQHILPLRTVR